MIDTIKALDWLNAMGGSSRLNNEVRRLLEEARKFPLDDVRLSLLLERLRNMGRAASDPLEKAEILLWSASLGFYRNTGSPAAARDAREAVVLYDCDEHRRAVALWILGMIQWEMAQNHQAYKNWSQAREIFRRGWTLFQNLPDAKNWYENRIQEMDIELVAHPEEIASWLNHFEASSLRAPTQQVINRVREKTRQQAYSNIYGLMKDLQEATQWSEGFYETAEVHLEFGLAAYQLRNQYAAMDFLRKSVRNFYPGFECYHKQVVARCLLGALEWKQDATSKQAAADWMQCLDEFEKLRQWADSDNCQDKEDWYSWCCGILHAALRERVRTADASDPDASPSEADRPEPPPPPPEPSETDLYRELLIKVRWDRGIADRLIELERKRAPTADRKELIQRAIERWLHDNG